MYNPKAITIIKALDDRGHTLLKLDVFNQTVDYIDGNNQRMYEAIPFDSVVTENQIFIPIALIGINQKDLRNLISTPITKREDVRVGFMRTYDRLVDNQIIDAAAEITKDMNDCFMYNCCSVHKAYQDETLAAPVREQVEDIYSHLESMGIITDEEVNNG